MSTAIFQGLMPIYHQQCCNPHVHLGTHPDGSPTLSHSYFLVDDCYNLIDRRRPPFYYRAQHSWRLPSTWWTRASCWAGRWTRTGSASCRRPQNGCRCVLCWRSLVQHLLTYPQSAHAIYPAAPDLCTVCMPSARTLSVCSWQSGVVLMEAVTCMYMLQGLIADGCSHLRGINTLIKEANSRQH